MRRLPGWSAASAILLAPAGAWAHSPVPGLGHFYNGALHPLVVPAHLVALIALGLWLGQRRVLEVPAAMAALIVATPVGLALSGSFGGLDTDTVTLAVGAMVALAVVAARALPRFTMTGLVAVLGLAIGLGSGPDGLGGSARWLSLAGTWLGVVVATSLIAAATEFARRDWMQVGVRVVASWVAASALIVLTLAWVGPRTHSVKPPSDVLSAPR